MKVDIPPDLYVKLAERARLEGLTIEQLVARLLARSESEMAVVILEQKRRRGEWPG